MNIGGWHAVSLRRACRSASDSIPLQLTEHLLIHLNFHRPHPSKPAGARPLPVVGP